MSSSLGILHLKQSIIYTLSAIAALQVLQDTVAVKFFIDRQAFHMEKLISSLPSLSRTVMQPNFVSNADEACCAPLGYILSLIHI